MTKRQVLLILLACWIGVFALIGVVWAVVQFWVLDDEAATAGRAVPSSRAYSTATALAADSTDATEATAAVEITPALEDAEVDLLLPTASPRPTDAAAAPEPSTESAAPPIDTAEPVDTPLPSHTPRPTASPVPSQTPTPVPTETPAAKTQGGGSPTKAPKPEAFKLYYRVMPDGSKQVFHQSTHSDELVAIFDPGDRRLSVHSAAWSPGGEHVLTVAEWITSKTEFGERLRIDNGDGSGGYDILFMSAYGVGGTEQARDMGSAIWSPDGQTIAMWYLDGANDGVYLINADGTKHRRMANSQPGDWPRWWSVDGEWIVVINDNGGLFALDVAETQRVPWDSLEEVLLYDQLWFPWRVTGSPQCRDDDFTTDMPWWRCG